MKLYEIKREYEVLTRYLDDNDLDKEAFKEAFTRLGGRLARRERGRFEATNVPASVRAASTQPIATRTGLRAEKGAAA